MTVTPVFGALRQVCKLIKHEFDPLYEEAGRQKVSRIDVVVEGQVWGYIYRRLNNLLRQRHVGTSWQAAIDENAVGKDSNAFWDQDPTVWTLLDERDLAVINSSWKIDTRKITIWDEYKKLDDWFWQTQEYQACYQVHNMVQFIDYPDDWRDEDGIYGCAHCSMYTIIIHVVSSDYDYSDTDEDDTLCGPAIDLLHAIRDAVQDVMVKREGHATVDAQANARILQPASPEVEILDFSRLVLLIGVLAGDDEDADSHDPLEPDTSVTYIDPLIVNIKLNFWHRSPDEERCNNTNGRTLHEWLELIRWEGANWQITYDIQFEDLEYEPYLSDFLTCVVTEYDGRIDHAAQRDEQTARHKSVTGRALQDAFRSAATACCGEIWVD
ncbi:hypothetical protein LTR95_002501 [Oleoguttula sp. CCFEE 5521]